MNNEGEEATAPAPLEWSGEKVGQEQIQGLLFGDKLSWQSIIYDLINSEQLDPWDIDISLLAQRFLDKVKKLEEANFFVSSKVLLAAALLLRIKSELLLEKDLQDLDNVLFGKKIEKKYVQERIELEEEIPGLVPRTPLPRFRKVTLQELMEALGNAIKTENRRIKKVVLARQQEMETAIFIPKERINLNDRIKGVYSRLKALFEDREEKLPFSELVGNNIGDKVYTFIPLLHLDGQRKVWLEQEGHLAEIWILLKHIYEKQNAEALENMRKEVEEEMKVFKENMSKEEKEMVEELEEKFENPMRGFGEDESTSIESESNNG